MKRKFFISLMLLVAVTGYAQATDAVEYYYKASQQYEAGDYSGAIQSAQKGLKMTNNPKLRGLLYGEMSGSYYGLGEKEKAVEIAHKGLGEDPFNWSLRYSLGVFLYELEKYDQALQAFRHFVEGIPNYKDPQVSALAAGYAYLGELQLKAGEIKNAEKNLLKSLSYEENQGAYLKLGVLYTEQEKYPAAIKCYEKGISFEPNRLSNIERYFNLGICYFRNDEIENAITALNKCLSCYEYNSELIEYASKNGEDCTEFMTIRLRTHHLLGRFYYLQNYWRESLKNYTEAAAVEDFMWVVWDYVAVAKCYRELGNNKQAEEILNKGLSKYENNPDLLFSKSLIYDNYNEEDIKIYYKILEQEFTYEPQMFDYATVYNNLAWAYFLQGNYKKGLPYAQKSVKMDSSHDYSWETLGQIYFKLGRYSECIDAMTKCIDVCPDCKNAYEVRGKAKIKLGRTTEGEKDLKMAKSL